ncbi:uncharacterized protein LOC135479704 [Liolophura sinensis]|uniref:uncharacterized protein LOC135479704 n=1 Tax=Liolophura sinensis TaxID=3198878 RepID=UPI0031586F92
MGAYGSKLREPKEVSQNPRDPKWIISHAKEAELDIPDVERLWKRFQALGCDKFGVLTISSDLREVTANFGEDVFVKNIWRNLKTTSANGEVTFLTFINLMKFSQSAHLSEKLRAVFHLLNKGSPLTEEILFRVMKHVYGATPEHEVLTSCW